MLARRLALAAAGLLVLLATYRIGAPGAKYGGGPARSSPPAIPAAAAPASAPVIQRALVHHDASDAALVQGHEVQLLRAAVVTPPRPGVVVLEFHAVLPEAQILADGLAHNDDVISVGQFGALLQWMRANHCHVVGLSAVQAVLAGQPVPPRAVALTFDDGYASSYSYVYPLLKAYGDPAVLFPVAGWLPGPDAVAGPSRLPYLTWPELREMAASGLVDVEGHTWNLHAMTAHGATLLLAAPAARRADLAKDRAAVASVTGHSVYAFAYPYGAWSPAAVADLRATGFTLAFAGLGRPVRQGDPPLLLTRIFVHPGAWPGFMSRYLSG